MLNIEQMTELIIQVFAQIIVYIFVDLIPATIRKIHEYRKTKRSHKNNDINKDKQNFTNKMNQDTNLTILLNADQIELRIKELPTENIKINITKTADCYLISLSSDMDKASEEC